MKIHDLLVRFKELGLPRDKAIVVGSGSLAIRKMRDAQDLDVIVTQDIWDELSQKYPVTKNSWGVERLALPHEIEILNPQFSIFGNSKIIPFDEICEKADLFEGVKFMHLEHLRKVKLHLGRPIDLADVQLIDDWR